MNAESHCYVGVGSRCPCRLAAVVDMTDKDGAKRTRKAVAEFMRDGLTIVRMTCEDFRVGPIGCQHPEDCKDPTHRAYLDSEARKARVAAVKSGGLL